MGGCRGDGGDHGFLGLPWGGGVAMGFSLGMFFVVVVVAGGYRGDLSFCFYLGFGIYYFIT